MHTIAGAVENCSPFAIKQADVHRVFMFRDFHFGSLFEAPHSTCLYPHLRCINVKGHTVSHINSLARSI